MSHEFKRVAASEGPTVLHIIFVAHPKIPSRYDNIIPSIALF